jgi:hypothetical protein
LQAKNLRSHQDSGLGGGETVDTTEPGIGVIGGGTLGTLDWSLSLSFIRHLKCFHFSYWTETRPEYSRHVYFRRKVRLIYGKWNHDRFVTHNTGQRFVTGIFDEIRGISKLNEIKAREF